MKNIGRLFRYIKPYWGRATLQISCNLLSVLFSLNAIIIAKPFLDVLFGTVNPVTQVGEFHFSKESIEQHFNYFISKIIRDEGEIKALLLVSILIIVSTFFKTFFRYMAQFNLAYLRNGVVRDIRNQIYTKAIQLPLSYYSDERKGDIIARISNDVQEIEWSIMSSLEMIFSDPITIMIYLGALFYQSPQLTLFALILLPVSGLIIGKIGKNLKKTSMEGQNMMGILLSMMEESLSGLRIIKAFNAEEKVGRRFRIQNESYRKLMTRLYRRRDMASPMSEFLGTVVMVSIMFYGATLVLDKTSTFTGSGFIIYLGMFYMIINPAKSFSTAAYNVQKGLASAHRIDHILKADLRIYEKPDAKPINEFKSGIEYKDLSFRYIETDVLKNIELRVEKGKSIALVGQSGSGKSTLVDLLPRFYDVQQGDILIDGNSIKDLKIKDLRSLMGIVNQESILFNDTIANNIAFGKEDATEEEIIAAAKIANAHEFILKTENGYQTNIGDRGTKLSGGQRQRISIARAVLKNPPVLILDEATSALDTESERLVQEAITNLMKNRTSIVIAHRLSTVQFVDEICVLHEGRIVEKGKHDELIKLNGYYKKLYDLQMFD